MTSKIAMYPEVAASAANTALCCWTRCPYSCLQRLLAPSRSPPRPKIVRFPPASNNASNFNSGIASYQTSQTTPLPQAVRGDNQSNHNSSSEPTKQMRMQRGTRAWANGPHPGQVVRGKGCIDKLWESSIASNKGELSVDDVKIGATTTGCSVTPSIADPACTGSAQNNRQACTFICKRPFRWATEWHFTSAALTYSV